MKKCKKLCFWSNGFGECKQPKTAKCPVTDAAKVKCASCDGGFGDNTLVFAARGYKFCPYCGRKLEVQDG